jgi:hypothetical protein
MSIALELFFVRGDAMSSRDWAICHHPALKIVVTPGAPRGQQSVTTPHHGLFPPLFSSFRWDTPKGEITRQNHHLNHKHLLRLAANGDLNNPKARLAVSR